MFSIDSPLELIAIPELVRFLGLQLDEHVTSDIKYAVEMLSSKDSKIFFSGLKILAAIHESNEESEKRTLAERLLAKLCKIIPSYVKRGAEFYELNKTKIEESIRTGKHPLDLKNTLALAKRGALPAGETEEKPTGFVISALPSTDSAAMPATSCKNEAIDDDIKVISIEDAMTGEEELVAMAKQDAARVAPEPCSPSAEAALASQESEPVEDPAAAKDALDLVRPEDGSYDDDEWVSAGSFTDIADGRLLFDKEGKIDKDFHAGLTLINPVERETEIDLNYSAAKGYHDPYRIQPAPIDMAAPSYVQPITGVPPPPDEPVSQQVTPVEGGALVGQQCGFGDGEISASDTAVYVCPQCKTPFHEGCGKLVLEVEGGRCPACDAAWK